jgi:hypothetical protein
VGPIVATTLAIGALAGPHYDVPKGYTRCPQATAWHHFFKWASAHHATCARTQRFMRDYGDQAGGPQMPRHVGGFTCTIRYWRDEDNQIYASRHVCTKGRATIRFYGMV